MNKIFFTAILAALSLAATAQEASRVSLRHDKGTGSLVLSFDFQSPAASGNDRLVITPLLSGQEAVAEFPPLVVEGRRARLSRQRRERSTGVNEYPGAVHVAGNSRARYESALAPGEWSGTGETTLEVKVERERCGCELPVGQFFNMPAVALLLPGDEPEPVAVAAPARVGVAPPTARPAAVDRLEALDRVAARYEFIAPVTPLAREILDGTVQRSTIDQYIDENETGALVIYFRWNNAVVDLSLGDNAATLARLEEGLRAVTSVPGTRARAIVVGAASPEGNALANDVLAMQRATAVNERVAARLSPAVIDARVISAGADWRGLRALVAASSMPGRDAVLRVIDTRPVWDPRTRVSRVSLLRGLNNGEYYRYMSRNFFPALRNAAYIKVFHEAVE
jgi:hypothetical protein